MADYQTFAASDPKEGKDTNNEDDNEDEKDKSEEKHEDDAHKQLRLLGIEMDDDGEDGDEEEEGDAASKHQHVKSDYSSREDVIQGTLDRLPPPANHTVAVYIIATATDFAAEKNLIQREAVPELRKYCYERGVELRMLDPRWSVREDVESDHQALEICLQQLRNAKKNSVGPFCVILLGERYGPMPWPSQIEESEFTVLYEQGRREGFDVLLLDDWFQKDENTAPARFMLQPVTSRFPFYNDETEANKQRRKKDIEDWAAISANMGKMLRKSVTKAYEHEAITYQQKLKYFRSVIEKEIVETFHRPESTINKVCLLARTFREPCPTDKIAKRYLDVSGNALDEEAYEKVCRLRETIIPQMVPADNIHCFTTGWDSHGITPANEEHEAYISKMATEFRKHLQYLVAHNVKQQLSKPEEDDLYKEIIRHSRLAAEHAANYVIKLDLLEEIYHRLCMKYVDETVPEEVEEPGPGVTLQIAEITENKSKEGDDKTDVSEAEPSPRVEETKQYALADGDDDTESTSVPQTPVQTPREPGSSKQSKQEVVQPSDGQIITEVKNANTETATEALQDVENSFNNNTPENDQESAVTNDNANVDDNMNKLEGELQEIQRESDESEKEEKIKEMKHVTNTPVLRTIALDEEAIEPISEDRQNMIKKVKKKKLASGKKKRKVKKKKLTKKVGFNATEEGDSPNPKSSSEDEYKVLTEDEMMIHKRLDIPQVSKQEELDQNQALLKEIHAVPLRVHHKPLIITGPIGTGKSTVLAKMIHSIEDWTGKPVTKIIRHLGSTSRSKSIRQVLATICQQIWDVYTIDKAKNLQIENEFTVLCEYFNVLLHKLPSKEKPLLIAIDGIENLNDADEPRSMKWLPLKLPVGVYVIVSMGNVLERTSLYHLQCVMKESERYLDVGEDLTDGMAGELLDKWMEMKNIRLNAMQLQTLMSRIKTNRTILFTKMALLQATTWRSYYSKGDLVVCNTIKETFDRLLTDLEKSFGRVVTSKILGYMTIARDGLTEQELEDILSCDDEVLLDAYLYYNPADEQVVRFPQLLWLRMHRELAVYIRYQDRDNRQVMTWVIDQIADVVRERYYNPEITYRYHGAMADYYDGKLANVIKGLHLPRRKGAYSQCQRKLPSQPLCYAPDIYNLRKMRQWPYHLVKSYRYSTFVEEICFKFEWLWSKCQATSLTEMLDDLDFATDQLKLAAKGLPTFVKNDLLEAEAEGSPPTTVSPISTPRSDSDKKQEVDEEDDVPFRKEQQDIELLKDILRLTQNTIKRQPHRLAVQLLAQLSPTGMTQGLQQLRKQVTSWCQVSSLPLLVPQSACMPFPGSPLITKLNLNIANAGGDLYQREQKLCLSNNTKILYGINHQKTGDYLVQYDISLDLQIISLTLLPRSDVKRISVAGKDANAGKEMYFRFELYKSRYKQAPEVEHRMCTLALEDVSTLPEGSELLALSHSGIYAAVKIPLTPGKASSGQLPLLTLVNILTGSKLNLFLGKPVEVQYTMFSPDEKYLVVFGKNGVYSFGVETAKVRHRWEEQRKNGVFSHNHVDRLRRCAVITKTCQLIMPGMEADNTSTIYRRDLRTGETMYEMKGTCYPIDTITMNEENTMAVAATCYPGVKQFAENSEEDIYDNVSRDKVAVIWDLDWGKQLNKVGRGPGTRQGTVFSALAFCGLGDDYLLTSSVDGQSSITMWYIGPRTEPCVPAIPLYELNTHSAPVIHIFVADRGQRLVTASLDNAVAVWDLAKVYDKCDKVLGCARTSSDQLEAVRQERNKEPDAPYLYDKGMIVSTSLAVSKNGQIGAVGTHDGWVIFYDLTTMKITKYEKVGQGKDVNFMICTKSGRYFISACEELRVWMPETGQCRHVLRVACRNRIDSLAESRDVLVAGYSGRECCAMVWDLHSGLRLRRLDGFYGFSKVAITSDACKVVGTFFDFPMIFNVHSGEPENSAHMETNEYDCTCLKVSPDDNFVASASTDGSVKVMDFKTGAYRLWLIHSSPVYEAIFTPNSMKLLTAGFKNIFIWSTIEGSLLGTLSFHTACIHQLHFVMQGRYLVSCSEDNHIVLWNFQEHKPVTSFQAHCPQYFVALTPDLTAILFSPRHISYIGVVKPNPSLRQMLGPTLADQPEPETVRIDHHYDNDSW